MGHFGNIYPKGTIFVLLDNKRKKEKSGTLWGDCYKNVQKSVTVREYLVVFLDVFFRKFSKKREI